MLLYTNISARQVEWTVQDVSRAAYMSNLTVSVEEVGHDRQGRAKLRFTLGVGDSFTTGARYTASGRALPKASWQAHRDVMLALFNADPEARLVTAFADYRGKADFEAKFDATGDHNVGSQMHPVRIADCAIPWTAPGLDYVKRAKLHVHEHRNAYRRAGIFTS